jgi:urease accessory protein
MYAHLQAHVGGWWDGVLHPVRSPGHLVTMIVVGLVGGIGVRSGRTAWALPAAFVGAMVAFGSIAAAVHRGFDVDALLLVMIGALVAVLVAPPRYTRIAAPLVVVACGALHGLAHGTDRGGRSRPGAYLAGFTFTGCLILAVGSIVGAATGRSLSARARRRRQVATLPADDHALV